MAGLLGPRTGYPGFYCLPLPLSHELAGVCWGPERVQGFIWESKVGSLQSGPRNADSSMPLECFCFSGLHEWLEFKGKVLIHLYTCTLCWKTPEADKAEAWDAQEASHSSGG